MGSSPRTPLLPRTPFQTCRHAVSFSHWGFLYSYIGVIPPTNFKFKIKMSFVPAMSRCEPLAWKQLAMAKSPEYCTVCRVWMLKQRSWGR